MMAAMAAMAITSVQLTEARLSITKFPFSSCMLRKISTVSAITAIKATKPAVGEIHAALPKIACVFIREGVCARKSILDAT